MIEVGLKGVEFIAINTDAQALLMSDADVKLDVAARSHPWTRCRADPRSAGAREDHAEEIEEVLKGADMVFVTAGEGGGTGTGEPRSSPRSPEPGRADHRRRHPPLHL